MAGTADPFQGGDRLSTVLTDLVQQEIPRFDVVGKRITTPGDFALLMMPLRTPLFESLKIGIVDGDGVLVHAQLLTVGSIAETTADPRDIIRVLEHARRLHPAKAREMSVIISHNHPSGDPSPSSADVQVTRRMEAVLQNAGSSLMDHVITDGETYYSFRGQGRGTIPGSGALAPWEAVPAMSRPRIGNEQQMGDIISLLRQESGDYGHVIALDTRLGVVAVERFRTTDPVEILRMADALAVAVGGFGVVLDLGHIHSTHDAMKLASLARHGLIAKLVDMATPEIDSFRAAGVLEQAPEYGTSGTVREEGQPYTAEPKLTDSPVPAALPDGMKENIFGQRLKADERLRTAWREAFNPALYRTFSEERLSADVRAWIGREGGVEGAAALFLDDNSGLLEYERNALGQQLAIALDLRARRMERAGQVPQTHAAEALLDAVTGRLEQLATQAGQALRAFGMWSRFSPRGIVRAVERKATDVRRKHMGDQTQATPAEIGAAVTTALTTDPAAPPLSPEERARVVTRAVEATMPPGRATPAARGAIPRMIDPLIRAHDAGQLDDRAVLEAWAGAFGLPRITPEFAAEIRTLVERVQAAPEGSWLRQQAQSALMARLAQWEGIPVRDVLTAFWYANLLSGPGTQLVNLSGNAAHLLMRTVPILLSNHPRHSIAFVRGMVRGAAEGIAQGFEAFRHGTPVMRGETEWTRIDVLEMLWESNPEKLWQKIARIGVASWGRYVFRALTAADAFFWHTAKEGRAWLNTSRGLATGGDLNAAMGYDAATWASAQQRAADDLRAAGIAQPSTRQIDRRAFEIVEQQRDAALVGEARQFGAAITYNYEPDGTMGAFARVANNLVQDVPPIRAVIPFVRIVANVADQSLDWTGYGLVRGALGRHMFAHRGARFTAQQRTEKAIAGAVGVLAAAALYAVAKSHEDKDDDRVPFMIYGMGPKDKQRRAQMPNGWKPFTVKIGDSFISYAETPAGMLLSAVGTAMDIRRYGNRKDTDEPFARASALMQGAGQSLLRTGVLSSLDKLLGTLDGSAKPGQMVARTASGFLPMQAAMRQLAEIIDPRKVDTPTFGAYLLSNIPILRDDLGPALNVFGDPVRLNGPAIIARIYTRNERPDPDAVWLSQRRLNIPGLDEEITAGTYLTEKDKATILKGNSSLPAQRAARAVLLEQMSRGYLTPEQRRDFIRLSGPLVRRAVQQLRRETATGSHQPADLQSSLQSRIRAVRRQTMLELLKR